MDDSRRPDRHANEADARYRVVVEQSRDPIYVADAGTLKILEWNRAFQDVLGYSDAELRELSIPDFVAHDRASIESFREQILASGSADMGDRRWRRKDGSVAVVQVHATLVPYDGVPAYCVVGHDVTERLEARRALEEKTAILECVAGAMAGYLEHPDWREASARVLGCALGRTGSEYGFLGVMVDGVLRVLAHQGVEWSRDEGRDLYQAALDAYREVGYLEFHDFENLFGLVVTTGRAVIANDAPADPRRGGVPGGHPPLRRFLGVPMLRGREAVGMIGVANRADPYADGQRRTLEILAQTAGILYEAYRRQEHASQLERQHRHAQKMDAIGRLAGGVAHEFNNLLAVIQSYGEFVQDGLPVGSPLRDDLDETLKAARRGAELTRQLLAFSRADEFQPQLIDLDELIANWQRVLRRTMGEAIELIVDRTGDTWPVLADPGQMEHVLLNLVLNARDAMPAGGTVVITTSNVVVPPGDPDSELPAGRHVRLGVADTGSGMPPDVAARAFEPFFTTKDRTMGTGLGLATVHGVMSQAGGHVRLKSEAGAGTTVELFLPAHAETAPGDAASMRRPGSKGST